MTGVLLITGGASGIGAETARRAATRGYKVAVNYRSRDAQAMGLAADIAAQVPLVSSVRNQLTIGGEVRPAVALARA